MQLPLSLSQPSHRHLLLQSISSNLRHPTPSQFHLLTLDMGFVSPPTSLISSLSLDHTHLCQVNQHRWRDRLGNGHPSSSCLYHLPPPPLPSPSCVLAYSCMHRFLDMKPHSISTCLPFQSIFWRLLPYIFTSIVNYKYPSCFYVQSVIYFIKGRWF